MSEFENETKYEEVCKWKCSRLILDLNKNISLRKKY